MDLLADLTKGREAEKRKNNGQLKHEIWTNVWRRNALFHLKCLPLEWNKDWRWSNNYRWNESFLGNNNTKLCFRKLRGETERRVRFPNSEERGEIERPRSGEREREAKKGHELNCLLFSLSLSRIRRLNYSRSGLEPMTLLLLFPFFQCIRSNFHKTKKPRRLEGEKERNG